MQIKLFFFRALCFLIDALLKYLGADIRTEQFCSNPSNPDSSPLVVGRGRGVKDEEPVEA